MTGTERAKTLWDAAKVLEAHTNYIYTSGNLTFPAIPLGF